MNIEKVIHNNTFFSQPLYITTPIFYPSGRPHIGHAYTLYSADALARLHRQAAQSETYFITGTDEHGEKLQRAAESHAVTPAAWVDTIVQNEWLPLLKSLQISNDDFIRTTQQRHSETVQAFVEALREQGFIYKGLHEGLYCVDCEEKKTTSELITGSGEFQGERVCAIHKRPVQRVSEENYFFRLSAFTQPLLTFIGEHPDFIYPTTARNEVLGWLKDGLEDLSISRTNFNWGIQLPWDRDHVIYVWFDALLSYLTALGYDGTGAAPDLYADAVHLIGRDILRFHALVLPALLLAHGLPLPRRIVAHGWLLARGEKIAKSSGNALSPFDLLEPYGTDALRYHLLRTVPLGIDGGISVEEVASTYTTILANGYGNLASRLHALISKHAGGVVPPRGTTHAADVALNLLVEHTYEQVGSADETTVLKTLLDGGERLIQAVNLYLTQQEPWRLVKDAAQLPRVLDILGTGAAAFLAAARLLAAVVPGATDRVEEAFGITLSNALTPGEVVGAVLGQLTPLFPRLQET